MRVGAQKEQKGWIRGCFFWALFPRCNTPLVAYNYWSPFENVAYAVHQVKIIHRNAHTIVQHLKAFDWLGLGLVSAIFGYLLGTPGGRSSRKNRGGFVVHPRRLSGGHISACVCRGRAVLLGSSPVLERGWLRFRPACVGCYIEEACSPARSGFSPGHPVFRHWQPQLLV